MTLARHRRTKAGQKHPTAGHLGNVAASYVLTLLDVAVARGADRAEVLSLAAVDAALLENPSARVPVSDLLNLFDAARRLARDPLLGLHMGQEAKPRTFSALGYAAMGAATLEEAAAQIPRYERLVYDGGKTTVSRAGATAIISWRSGLESIAAGLLQPLNEAIVAGWLSFGRWITGLKPPLTLARFQHQSPGDRAALSEYAGFFGCPVEFGAEDNALLFPSEILDLPIVLRDDGLRLVMESRATAALRELDGGRPVTLQASAVVRDRLSRGVPTMAEVGRALGLSDRTLRRRLALEGQSFQNLLSEIRHELAMAYLRDPTLSLLDIALLLGYSDQSAFSAAFSVWSGMSPSAARGGQGSGRRGTPPEEGSQ
jgi:AraC-like DNA-binding protein